MISIIIPSLNSPVIDRVIAALRHQTAQYEITEIIVVGQDQFERVPHVEGVRFVYTPEPLPLPQARNVGARLSCGQYLLFLDADCIATTNLIERLVARHGEGHRIVGGSVMTGFHDYWTRCDHMLIYARYMIASPMGFRTYLPGGNLSISRDLFLQHGGFDEHFSRTSGEDVDLARRVRRAGHELFFEPRASVWHWHQRASIIAVTIHLWRFGQTQAILWATHGAPTPINRYGKVELWAILIFVHAPLLALWDVLLLYITSPALRHYWNLLPGMVWAKQAWYWGLTAGLLAQH